jgi:glutathione S-transferase
MAMADTFTLHGVFLSGPTFKAGLTLALCGQAFDYRHVNLAGGEHKSPEFLKLNRYGQVPVLQHGSLTLCQSGAIMEYVSQALGKLTAKDLGSRQKIHEWLFWDADALSPPIYRLRAFQRGIAKFEPPVVELFGKMAGAATKTLDGCLEGKTFLMGAEPTIADVACYGACWYTEEAKIDLSGRPNIQAWMKRVEALPGFKKPYDLLPKESAKIAA